MQNLWIPGGIQGKELDEEPGQTSKGNHSENSESALHLVVFKLIYEWQESQRRRLRPIFSFFFLPSSF